MIRQDQIAVVLDAQKEIFQGKTIGLIRSALNDVPAFQSFATIITGLRRCGKSTLLLQVLRQRYTDALFLNFDDIRLTGFEPADFTRLYNEIAARKINVLFLDEIQLIEKWEIFVHQLLREDYTVFVTGSNASLLSREMGTHLTGRYVSMELFPFSFEEYLRYKKADASNELLQSYLQSGGLPEYIKTLAPQILQNLVEDILVRDIAVRHSIRDVESLKQLAIYLLSNVGTPVSANKLAGIFGIKSSATLLEYFSYFKNAYLIELLPQFNYSLKAQARNPKKIYAMDNGFISAISTTFSENNGRRLENLVYVYLRRLYKELYFFKEKNECDFVVLNKGKAIHAIQVCYKLDDENADREYKGLIEALMFFKLTEGTIVTFNQKDIIEKDGYSIKLIPAHEWLGTK